MTAALKPCQNPECGGSDPRFYIEPIETADGRRLASRFQCVACGVAGPRAFVPDYPELGRCIKANAEARRLWDLLPREPRWTSEPPTAPGDYLIQWWRSHKVRQVAIQDADIGLALASAWGPESRRYGPIPEPQSPVREEAADE